MIVCRTFLLDTDIICVVFVSFWRKHIVVITVIFRQVAMGKLHGIVDYSHSSIVSAGYQIIKSLDLFKICSFWYVCESLSDLHLNTTVINDYVLKKIFLILTMYQFVHQQSRMQKYVLSGCYGNHWKKTKW